jgi:hypothetical protein
MLGRGCGDRNESTRSPQEPNLAAARRRRRVAVVLRRQMRRPMQRPPRPARSPAAAHLLDQTACCCGGGGGGWHLEGGDGGGGQRVLGARARHGERALFSFFSSSKKPRRQECKRFSSLQPRRTERDRLNAHWETRIRATNSRWVDGRHHCRGVELEGWNGNDKGVWVREGFYVYGGREGVRGGWRWRSGGGRRALK